jgi:hypothetical protein
VDYEFQAVVTMDPGSCMRELVCEFDQATNQLKRIDSFHNTWSASMAGSRQK